MEERIVKVKIGGKEYAMLFSVRASQLISVKFGSIQKMGEALQSETDAQEKMATTCWLLAALIGQGQKAMSFETGRVYDAPSAEALECIVTPGDIPRLLTAVRECIVNGSKRTLETDTDEGN